jgi:cytolethal distending toxin subunit B
VRLATWNMQGGNASTELKWRSGVLAMMQMTEPWRPDFVCVQEAGKPPESAQLQCERKIRSPTGGFETVAVYSWGGSSSRGGYTIVFHEWDAAGHRVNAGIVSREAPSGGAAITLIWPATAPIWRPAVGVNFGEGWLFSNHSISPGGTDAPGMLAAVAVAAGASAWRVAGDFNRDPDTLQGPAGSAVCPPNSSTYSVTNLRSRYDYCVRGHGPQVGGMVLSLVMSDHYPVAFDA